jgi:hypothetical protein
MPDTESAKPSAQITPIKDARGRSVMALDPVMMHLLHRRDGIPAEQLREMAQEIGIGMTKTTRVLFWISLLCIALALIVLGIHLVHGIATGTGFRRLFRQAIPFIGIWVGPFIMWFGARSVRIQRIGKVMLKHLRCPHCGYDIRGLPTAEEDGATVCPECGCAWKLDGGENTPEE